MGQRARTRRTSKYGHRRQEDKRSKEEQEHTFVNVNARENAAEIWSLSLHVSCDVFVLSLSDEVWLEGHLNPEWKMDGRRQCRWVKIVEWLSMTERLKYGHNRENSA